MASLSRQTARCRADDGLIELAPCRINGVEHQPQALNFYEYEVNHGLRKLRKRTGSNISRAAAATARNDMCNAVQRLASEK